jgi:circadian clock protein KaiB
MTSSSEAISLKLYVANGTPNSILAVRNLNEIIDEYLNGRHSLEVIDVLKKPSIALDDGVLVTPTLIKLSPPPRISIIGNLGNKEKVLHALNLEVR